MGVKQHTPVLILGQAFKPGANVAVGFQANEPWGIGLGGGVGGGVKAGVLGVGLAQARQSQAVLMALLQACSGNRPGYKWRDYRNCRRPLARTRHRSARCDWCVPATGLHAV